MNKNFQLDAEEQDILDSYERDEWRSVANVSEAMAKYQTYAIAALEQAGLVSIALPPQEIGILRQKAAEAGIPYQTLIAKILHQYVSGTLIEKPRSA